MIFALLQLVVGVLVLSALLTPLVYDLLGAMLGVVPWPFSRVFDRVAMLVALVLLLLLRKRFPLGRVRERLVDGWNRTGWLLAIVALCSAVVGGLAALPVVIWQDGVYWADRSLEFYVLKAPKYILAAIIIALVEESFFRVLLLERLRERWNWLAAAVVVSILYAAVHFIRPDKSYKYIGDSWLAGFEYLNGILMGAFVGAALPAFIGFLLVGLILAAVAPQRWGLYLCWGLHGGWILAEKFAKQSIYFGPEVVFHDRIGGRYFLIGNPAAWFAILLIGGLVIYFKPGHNVQAHELSN